MGAIAPWHQRKSRNGNGGNSEAKPTRLASFATSTTLPVAEQALAWLQEQDVLTPGLQRKIRDAVSQGRKSGRDLIAQGLYDRIKRELTESVEGGESATEWRDRVKDIGGVTQSQVETIGRTYSHRAYHEGMKTIMDDPVVADEFPYLQYFATQDTRTRPTHLAMDGKVAHRDSPMAAQMQALLAEWNCRCGSAPLSREDALAEGIDDDTGWKESEAEDEVATPDEQTPIFEGQPRITEQDFVEQPPVGKTEAVKLDTPNPIVEKIKGFKGKPDQVTRSTAELLNRKTFTPEEYEAAMNSPDLNRKHKDMIRKAAEKSALTPEQIRERDELARQREKEGQELLEKTEQRIEQQLEEAHNLLLAAGCVFEHQSDSRSRYYQYGKFQIRVSDHFVPMTAERSGKGGSWAGGRGSQIILPVANVAAEVARVISDNQPEDDEPASQRIDELISALAPKPPAPSSVPNL